MTLAVAGWVLAALLAYLWVRDGRECAHWRAVAKIQDEAYRPGRGRLEPARLMAIAAAPVPQPPAAQLAALPSAEAAEQRRRDKVFEDNFVADMRREGVSEDRARTEARRIRAEERGWAGA